MGFFDSLAKGTESFMAKAYEQILKKEAQGKPLTPEERKAKESYENYMRNKK